MIFVRVDDLKAGMRLARPIYNKNGVLLYERNTKLPVQGIYSIKNFGLLGLYILEPAEPLPPMSAEDIEFERFTTMSVFSVKEEFDSVYRGRQMQGFEKLVISIIKSYGSKENKINFLQNLRSSDDYVYKHAIGVAILSALISGAMDMSVVEQTDIVKASILRSIGEPKLSLSLRTKKVEDMDDEEKTQFRKATMDIVETMDISPRVKSLIMQSFSELNGDRISDAAKVLQIADAFDNITAMSLDTPPKSEIYAVKQLIEHQELYDKRIVNALIKSISIVVPGVCVELTNNEKALVITENPSDILRPVVLGFNDNKIYDLSLNPVYEELQIRDIMKTMDNRTVINKEMLDQYMGKK